MADTKFDIIIIGGGPGGYVAAIRASQLGMKVALIERENLGGICLNWGCIPTKALLRTSEVHHILNNLDDLGLTASNISFDIEKVVSRSRNVARKLNQGIGHLLKKNNVKVLMGEGQLSGPGEVTVTDKSAEGNIILKGKNIVLASGARPRTLPGLDPDGEMIWTYREAMVPKAMPESLLVVGSGAIGMEFSSFYSDLGANVTVVELMDRILPVEDEEIAALARQLFEGQGMTIHTNASVKALSKNKSSVKAEIDIGGRIQTSSFDRVILAVGIVGNVENMGLGGSGVVVENSHVIVNEVLETGEAGVFAIGDLVGPPWLAHKASHEAIICVERIAGLNPKPLDPSNIPGCTYCRPQIASIGFTEEGAKRRGHKIKVGRFPFLANGKAIAQGEEEGLVKTVFDVGTGELLGAHMIGAEVTEMIQGYAIARASELTEEELMHTVFPHPSMSEAMHESVLDAFGRVIHL